MKETLQPVPERRRQVSDDLFHALATGEYTFWEHVHPLFMGRDMTRQDMRDLVRRGLNEAQGNYRSLLTLFGMPISDYKRFLNFLGTHNCRVDFREFRAGSVLDGSAAGAPDRRPEMAGPALAASVAAASFSARETAASVM